MFLHISAPLGLMSRFHCIADRFVMTDRCHAIDLATGERVKLTVTSVSDRNEHAGWVSRCDARYRLSAFGGGNLVDFGACGESHRFEAWQGTQSQRVSGGIIGIEHVERRVEAALAELFEGDRLTPRVVCLFGPCGCGKTRVLRRLARSARLNGFVPFAVDLLDSPLSTAIDGRSVCLIDDERKSDPTVLVELTLRSPRPHVVFRASVDDTHGIPSVRLTKLASHALVSAVVPRASLPEAVVRRAAERADGNPGRFIGLINPSGDSRVRFDSGRNPVAGRSRAAEQAPVYGAAAPAASAAWPIPGEVATLRRQIQQGIRHLHDGRHAPGERDLRQAIGGLARRSEWTEAGEGSLALAASLLKRGRAHDAKTVVDTAHDACRRAPGNRLVIAAATISCRAS